MRRILVADDDANNRELLITILEHHGFEVIPVPNGQAAVQAADAYLPDLVLMDLEMPIIDGFEATRQIRRNGATAHIPVVAVSAYITLRHKEAALAAGCDGFLAKPLDVDGLKEQVEGFMLAYEPLPC